jgi:hypothetical protein
MSSVEAKARRCSSFCYCGYRDEPLFVSRKFLPWCCYCLGLAAAAEAVVSSAPGTAAVAIGASDFGLRRCCYCSRRRVHADTLSTPSSPRDHDATPESKIWLQPHPTRLQPLCRPSMAEMPLAGVASTNAFKCSAKCPTRSNFLLNGLHAKY